MKNHRSCITIFQAPWRSQCPTRKMSLLKCFPWQMEEEFPSFHVWFVWASLIESRNTSPSPLVEVTNNKQLPSSFGWTWWKCSLGGRYCWWMHYCNSWTNNIASRTPTFERHPHPFKHEYYARAVAKGILLLLRAMDFTYMFRFCPKVWYHYNKSAICHSHFYLGVCLLTGHRWTPWWRTRIKSPKRRSPGPRGCNSVAEDFEGKTVQQIQKKK